MPAAKRKSESRKGWRNGRTMAIREDDSHQDEAQTGTEASYAPAPPVAARTKSGALPRCCGKAQGHLAKLIT